MSSGDAPMMRAHAMVNRVADLLEECHALKRDLEESDEPASVETECETLVSSIEAGLVRTMEDVLTILQTDVRPTRLRCVTLPLTVLQQALSR